MKLTDSQKINFLLHHFDLNVSQFAESLGVSKQSIRNIINERSELPTHARGDGLGFGSQHSH